MILEIGIDIMIGLSIIVAILGVYVAIKLHFKEA